jgi:hypothetical protein
MGQVTSIPYYLAAGSGLLSVVDEDAATSCDQAEGASQSGAACSADILPDQVTDSPDPTSLRRRQPLR